MEKISAQKIAILSAALIAAFTIGASIPDGDQQATPIGVDAGVPPPVRVEVATPEYHRQMDTFRKANPGAIDLLSPTVEPGKTVTTGVNVDLGGRPADVQAASGSWTIGPATFTDGESETWIEVTATNTGAAPSRFVGILTLAP